MAPIIAYASATLLSESTVLFTAIDRQLSAARTHYQRRLVVLSGERQWAWTIFSEWFARQQLQQGYTVGAPQANALALQQLDNKRARSLLGQSIDCLYYDAWSGFDPDAFAALVGALGGGGLLLLAVPPLQEWPNYEDPDYQRLLIHPLPAAALSHRFISLVASSLEHAPQALIAQRGSAPRWVEVAVNTGTSQHPPPSLPAVREQPSDLDCMTVDQQRAVAAILKVARGRARRPLVIKSDRGRGKSSALGIASARLMARAGQHIIVTAPLFSAVGAVMERASALLGEPVRDGEIHSADSSLRFFAVDELLRVHHPAQLLLVDEAAAIPAPQLERLLKRYPRVVFASTVHGYEGTGRGFDIRFKHTLNTLTPQWSTVQLHQPIRWADHDPVEQWLFQALLLDAAAPLPSVAVELDRCRATKLDRDQLLTQPLLLQQLFALLLQAHYQTSPSDLRALLDGPNIEVWISCQQGQLLAAALVAIEGDLEADLAAAIWRGERRPRGHLLPQTLTFHSGFVEAAGLNFARIIRIAVQPGAARNGLGQQLLGAIEAEMRLRRFDFVGASFAATADVLAFWGASGFVAAGLGSAVDASSGCYSAIVLRALSPAGQHLLKPLQQRFSAEFQYQLPLAYQGLDPSLVALLIQMCPFSPALTQRDWSDIVALSEGTRPIEGSAGVLSRLVLCYLARPAVALEPDQVRLLVRRLLQHGSVPEVSAELGLSGAGEQLKALRAALLRISKTRLGTIESATEAASSRSLSQENHHHNESKQ